MANAFVDWLQKKVVQPVEQAPENFEKNVATPIDESAIKTPVGRGLQTVGLGGLRAATGLAQAGAGLVHIAHPNQTTAAVGKNLTEFGKETDQTVKENHGNEALYHGAQIATNLIPTNAAEDAIAGGVKAIPKVAELAPKVEDLTKGLAESGHLGNITAKTIRGATSLKNLGVNAAYQAFSAGQQAAQGQHVNPKSQLENLGVYQAGFPLAGAGSKESLDAVAPVIAKTAKGIISKFGEPALAGAEKATGLSRNTVVNDNEANTLRDEADRVMGDKVGNYNQTTQQAHAIAKNIGLDIDSGAPADRAARIEGYLSQRHNFVTAHNQIAQGGYLHFTKPEVAAKLEAGEPFDFTKPPVHGTKSGNDFGEMNGRMVSDGKPAMYLSLDDNKWKTGLSANPNAKPLDISKMSHDEQDELVKNGGDISYNYKTQQYEGRENPLIKTPLKGVDYNIKPGARTLVIDSPEKLTQVERSVGTTPDDSNFWSNLRSKYDVVELRNVDKGAQTPEMVNKHARNFFRGAKGDQAIVLNPDMAELASDKATGLSKIANEPTDAVPAAVVNKPIQPTPEEPTPDTQPIEQPSSSADQNVTPDQLKMYTDLVKNSESPQEEIAPLSQKKIEPPEKVSPTSESSNHNTSSLPNTIAADDFNRKVTDNSNTITKEQYAEAFGLTPLQAAQDFEDMGQRELDAKHMSKEQLANLGPQSDGLTVAQKRELIRTDAKQATKNQVELHPVTHESYSLKDRARSAIAQSEGINEEAEYRLQRALTLGKNLTDHDKQLLYKYDAGSDVVSLASHANKPIQFMKAAKAYENALDYDLSARRAGYEPTLRQNNYVPHNYAVSQKWMDEHQIPEDQRIAIGDEVRGFRDISAKYPSYQEAAKQTGGKLKPLYDSPIEDLEDYVKHGAISRRNHLLGAALGKATPGDVGLLREIKVGDKGLTQAAGHLPFSASDELQQHLAGYKRLENDETPLRHLNETGGALIEHHLHPKVRETLSKGGNAATKYSKKILFAGSPFHYVNEQASFIGKNLLNPKNLALGEKRFVQNVATKGGFQKLLDEGEADGTLEKVRRMGVLLPDDGPLSRASSAFALTEAQEALRKNLNPDSKEAVDLGQQINHLMGHRNSLTESVDPSLRKKLGASLLAPSWSVTQLQLLKDAITGGTKGKYARGAVIGKRALLAGVGIGGSAAIAHKVPTLSQALNEAGLTLKNPVPNVELNTKNKSNGEAQEMVSPTDSAGLAVGLLANPGHFVSSRLSPVASFADKLLTNEGWNGQPLATGPKDTDYYRQLVEHAAANSFTPIGIQNFTNLTDAPNNPDLLQGMAQQFGGRLKTNPNDPNYKATQEYYDAVNKVQDSLSAPEDQGTLAAVTNYLTSYKNSAGKTEFKAPAETMARWQSLVGDPKALESIQKVQTSGKDPDPAWQLPSNGNGGTYIGKNGKPMKTSKLQVYAMYESMVNGDANRTQLEQLNPWINKVFTNEQTWFNKLTTKGQAVPYSGPLPGGLTKKDLLYPNLSSAQNRMMSQVTQLSSIPAAKRTTLQMKQLSNLENNSQLHNAYNALDTYSNNMRVAKGYSPLKYAPSEPPAVTEGIAAYDALPEGTGARSAWIAAHPDLYTQMSNYYAASDQATIDKGAALAELQGEKPTSSLLGAEYDAGKYDVAKTTNSNGTSTYSVNPALAYSQSSGGSGGSYYETPQYIATHVEASLKNPSVVKLQKEKNVGKEIKATYKKPKATTPIIHSSTISQGSPRNIGKKLPITGLA